jgi:hypothetical protein
MIDHATESLKLNISRRSTVMADALQEPNTRRKKTPKYTRKKDKRTQLRRRGGNGLGAI